MVFVGAWDNKLYAFGLAATIAALGGILLGFRSTNVVFTNFGALPSPP